MPPGIELLNANDRIHYKQRSKKTERLRSEAFRAVGKYPMTFGRCRIICIFRAPDNRRRDTANLYPSFKACLDGIVDAKVLADDNDKYVTSLTLMRGENLPRVKYGQLILEIIEVEE